MLSFKRDVSCSLGSETEPQGTGHLQVLFCAESWVGHPGQRQDFYLVGVIPRELVTQSLAGEWPLAMFS